MSCTICDTGRAMHEHCVSAALSWIACGSYDSPVDRDLARQLAPMCYLCGAAKTQHAEHVYPLALGGRDTWGNIGGACAPCNLSKGDTSPLLTEGQWVRWSQQQDAYRLAWLRISPEAVGQRLLRLAASPTWDYLPPDMDEVTEAIEDTLDMMTEIPFTVSNDDTTITVLFPTGGRLDIYVPKAAETA